MRTPYEILGVPGDADDGRIKEAYLAAARRWPPDRYPEQFQRVRAAYEAIATRRNRIAHELFDTTRPTAADLAALLLTEADPPALNAARLREALAANLKAVPFPLE